MMPAFASAAVFAYLITTACCILLMKRSTTQTIRFLAFSIGLMPLCQSIIIMANHHVWVGPVVGKAAEYIQLPASALMLTAVYLLNKENADRHKTESLLRVAEASPASPAESVKPEQAAPAKLA